MPVKVAQRGDKYRIVGPDDKLELNNAGTPVDGGGHFLKKDADDQAAAINSNIKKSNK